jgi:alkanesulfonate monooxygenase SsuD/methylene tetrahydromethanopterin reductase-like flavin-dependent oxidoreductase (luciferase family)
MDHISNGRFVLGLGNGYRLAELEAAGVTRKERAPRVEESIEIMKRLWAGEDLDFKGRFWNVKGRMALTPVQKGGPPIWIAVHADGAAQRGARLADGVLIGPQIYLADVAKLSAVYQEECAKLGRPRGTIGISRRLAVIRNEKDRADVMAALKASAEHSIKMYGTWDMQETGMVDIRLDNVTNIHNEYTILGSPEECVEQINRYKEATNMDLFQFNLVNSLPDVKAREEAMQFVWEEILSKVK